MKKKVLSALLTTAMAASLLAGCGNQAANGGGKDGSVSDGGKVFNIYCGTRSLRAVLRITIPVIQR